MLIGDLSTLSGVNVETIRYYERAKIIPRAKRLRNGHRAYSPDDVRRLVFIRRARTLGFEVSAVTELLKLQEKPNSCGAVSKIASAQADAIDDKIQQLVALRDELRRMAKQCERDGKSGCHIIDILNEERN